MQYLARSFLVIVILVLALDLFATLPAQAAQEALHSGTWDLADYVRGAVATRPTPPPATCPCCWGRSSCCPPCRRQRVVAGRTAGDYAEAASSSSPARR